jgi:hypothetical protein
MAHYRLYALDHEGQFSRAANFECSTDEEALDQATGPRKPSRPVALWRIGHSGRWLKEFDGKPKAENPSPPFTQLP